MKWVHQTGESAARIMEAGARVRALGKLGMLLVRNDDATWCIDFDDNTEADLPAADCELVEAQGTSPLKSATGAKGETVESLAARHAELSTQHDAALKGENFKAAGELLTEMDAVDAARRKLARGDGKQAREREKTAHQQKLLELRRRYEKEASAKMKEVQGRVLVLDPRPVASS